MRHAADERFDAVVIGSGIGGLTCAVALARRGRRVVVLEKNSEAGGNCTVLERGGLRFEACQHQIGGLLGPQGVGALLARLGVVPRLTATRLRETVTLLHPGGRLVVGDSLETFEQALLTEHPAHSRALRAYVDFLRGVADLMTLRGWSEGGVLRGLPPRLSTGCALRLPSTVRRVSALQDLTFAAFLARFFPSLPPLPALCPFAPYYGLPPSRVSALLNVGITLYYLASGSWVPDGGTTALTGAFVATLEAAGGTLRTSCPATRLERDGADLSVITADGIRLRAPVVVVNAPICSVLDGVAAPGLFPDAWVAGVRALRPSCSMARVFATTDLPDEALASLPYETFVYDPFDLEVCYAATWRGQIRHLTFQLPHRIDPSNRAPGRTPLILTGLIGSMDRARWREERERLTADLARLASRALPGLERHLQVVAVLGPPDLEARLSVPGGAMYGWECAPDQTSARRLPVRTPASGVYLASQWAQPSHGVPGVIRSGWTAARTILGEGWFR